MRKALIFILVGISCSFPSMAEIYKHVASNGLVEFTDTPKNNNYQRFAPKPTSKIYKYVSPEGKIYFTDKRAGSSYILYRSNKPAAVTNFASYFPRSNNHKNKYKYNELIATVAERYNIDPNLLHAVIRVESAYNSSAVSNAGAAGLMQLMPATARRYGVYDRLDPEQNIEGGAHYLKDLMAMFDSNLALAIAAYNAGENAVIKYNNSIPPYPETQNYVKQVLAYYQR